MLFISFNVLLTSLSFALSIQATPLKRTDRGLVTMPLQRSHNDQSTVHPQILLQQHINRNAQRLAQMKGHTSPSKEELDLAMHKRVLSVERPLHNNGSVNQPRDGFNVPLDLATFPNIFGYIVTVNIGSSQTHFELLLDSGSSDLWIPDSKCQVADIGGGCGVHPFINNQISPTLVSTNTPFNMTYNGNTSVNGTVVMDNVIIGGLPAVSQSFGSVSSESPGMAATPCDGIIGFAQPKLSAIGDSNNNIVMVLAAKNLIAESIISYYFTPLGGEITLGGLDESKFDSTTQAILDLANENGFWEVIVDDVTVDGTSLGLKNQGRTVILDTGTTLFVAPLADAEAIHEKIQGSSSDGQGGFTVPCDMKEIIALQLGGEFFSIKPADMVFGPPLDGPGGNTCTSSISGHSGTTYVAGDVFFRSTYFSTDFTKLTVTVAKLK